VYYRLSEFWRVAYHASPLEVSLEYQDGSGRFDDPERTLAVLYGGDSATTCILEVALPWKPHVDATYVDQSEAPDEGMDADEQRLALEQAERDREIAKRPPTLPASLYEKSKVFVQLANPVVLCDLDDVSVRIQLSKVPTIAAAMSACGVPQLDRSIIIAQGPHLEITRVISGYLMRQRFGGHEFAGIRTISRWKGEMFVLFQDRYRLGLPLVGPIRLHRDDPDVLRVAAMAGLVP
jgi:hypothetical protein